MPSECKPPNISPPNISSPKFAYEPLEAHGLNSGFYGICIHLYWHAGDWSLFKTLVKLHKIRYLYPNVITSRPPYFHIKLCNTSLSRLRKLKITLKKIVRISKDISDTDNCIKHPLWKKQPPHCASLEFFL